MKRFLKIASLSLVVVIIILSVLLTVSVVTKKGQEDTDLPDFERYGIVPSMKVDVPVVYATACEKDQDKIAKGTLTVTQYTRGSLSAASLRMAEENQLDLSGYEELTVDYTLEFFNAEAAGYNPLVNFEVCDYYHIELFDMSSLTLAASDGTSYRRYLIRMDGSERYVYYAKAEERTFNQYSTEYPLLYTRTIRALVPAGYDGIVAGYLDNRIFRNGVSADRFIFERYDPEKYYLFRLD